MRGMVHGTIAGADPRSPGSRKVQRDYNRAVSRTYSLRDANGMVPEIAVVVQRLQALREEVIALRDAYQLAEGVTGGAGDTGLRAASRGAPPDREFIRLRLRGVVDRMQADAAWLDERDIALRDIATGLLDFPSLAHGQPVWLCWRLGEASVTAWHPKDEGFAGRRLVAELGELGELDDQGELG
jgi:hypothetical protein